MFFYFEPSSDSDPTYSRAHHNAFLKYNLLLFALHRHKYINLN